MVELLSSPQAWIAFATLTLLEVVLGIDNIVFIAILAGKLPADQQPRTRKIGLWIAMATRVLMLLSIGLILGLTTPVFTLPFELGNHHEAGMPRNAISWKDLVLIAGGLFLVAKATHEIHTKLEGVDGDGAPKGGSTFNSVIVQLFILNFVFSIDSVVTAIGMADHIAIMVAAVVVSTLFMLVFAGPVAGFVEKHPTVKILALSFLVLIGVNLLVEGFHYEIPKGYTYFAMAFAVLVEMLNLKLRKKGEPVHLHFPTR